jgi:hypothetical protein
MWELSKFLDMLYSVFGVSKDHLYFGFNSEEQESLFLRKFWVWGTFQTWDKLFKGNTSYERKKSTWNVTRRKPRCPTRIPLPSHVVDSISTSWAILPLSSALRKSLYIKPTIYMTPFVISKRGNEKTWNTWNKSADCGHKGRRHQSRLWLPLRLINTISFVTMVKRE